MQLTTEKGTTMINTEHSSKAPHSTGIFATLRALLHVQGSGALTALPLPLARGVLLLAPAVASANSAHSFSAGVTLGSGPGSGARQLELAAPLRLAGVPYFYAAGSGVAVSDETHDVYVADTGNRRVDEFEPDGMFVRAWGWGVGAGGFGFETCGPKAA